MPVLGLAEYRALKEGKRMGFLNPQIRDNIGNEGRLWYL